MTFAESVAQEFGCTIEEAKEYIKGWLTRRDPKDDLYEEEEDE